MVMGLIDQHVSRSWQLAHERLYIAPSRQRAGRVVRVADVHQPGGGVSAGEHRVQVVGVVGAQGDRSDLCAGPTGALADPFERRSCDDELSAGSHEGVNCHPQDFAGAAAEDHLVESGPVQGRDA